MRMKMLLTIKFSNGQNNLAKENLRYDHQLKIRFPVFGKTRR